MHTHIGPRRVYTSDWEFASSYRPRRTAFGALLGLATALVALAVAGMIAWLVATDPQALRLGLVMAGFLALTLMARGRRGTGG